MRRKCEPPSLDPTAFRLAIRSEYIRSVRNSSALAYREMTEKLIVFANADGDSALLMAISDAMESVRADLGIRAAKVARRIGE